MGGVRHRGHDRLRLVRVKPGSKAQKTYDLPLRQTPKKVKRPFGTSRKENAMTYISNVWVIHTTAGNKDAETDADFELIVKGPGGYLARADFEDLPTDEREKGTTDMYRFIFDEPFDWDPARWTVSMRMTSTKDGWLPSTIFVLGK